MTAILPTTPGTPGDDGGWDHTVNDFFDDCDGLAGQLSPEEELALLQRGDEEPMFADAAEEAAFFAQIRADMEDYEAAQFPRRGRGGYPGGGEGGDECGSRFAELVGAPQRASDQVAWLTAITDALAEVDGLAQDAGQGERIEVLSVCERLKAALAAAQARVSVAFADTHTADAHARGLSPRAASRGITPQLALARGCSPSAAQAQLSQSRALTSVLPHTLAALTAGLISPAVAGAVCAEAAGLSEDDQRLLDAELGERLPVLTLAQARAAAAQVAARLDPDAVLARHAKAVSSRGAWTRPAPDGMAYLTLLDTLPRIVSAYACLHRHATGVLAGADPDDPPGERTYSQVLADTAIARLSGLASGQFPPAAVTLVMTPDNLYGKNLNDLNDLFTPTAPSDTTDNTDTDTTDTTDTTGASDTDSDSTADSRATDTTGSDSGANETADADPTDDGEPTDQPGPGDPDTHNEPNDGGAEPADTRAGSRSQPADESRPAAELAASPGPAEPAAPADPGDDRGDPDKAADPDDTDPAGVLADQRPPDPADTHPDSHPATESDPITEAPAGEPPTPTDQHPPTEPAWHRPGEGSRCAGAADPVRILGHGTIPAALAREWLLCGCDTPDTDTDTPDNHCGPPGPGEHPAAASLRRAFTSPDRRDLIALESTARLFPPLLRSLLILRDDRCRMPHCDAPIRHADHAVPAAKGGPTSYQNGQGLSAGCNYTKDLPGFTTRVLTRAEIAAYAAGPETDRNTHIARNARPRTHITAITTPTGHTYLSIPPPALGWGHRPT
ncbi:MAG: DUF222 domain-containing protein [Tetrasphaera sp.]